MSTVIKKVNRGISSELRTQSFTKADVAQGDIIDVNTSLGRPARLVRVTNTSDGLSLRFNVMNTVYHQYGDAGTAGLAFQEGQPIMASGVQYIDRTGALVSFAANTSRDFSLSVNDIEVVTISGQVEIFVE